MTDDPAQAQPVAWSNPGLGQAGTVLLLVGWIVGIIMSGLSLVMGLMFLMWRQFGGRMMDWMMDGWMEHAPPDRPFWMLGDAWGIFAWFTVALTVLSLIATVAGTVLAFLGWQAVNRGDHQRGGMLGIIGGVVMLLFSSISGLLALLGGVFVLSASNKTGREGPARSAGPSPGDERTAAERPEPPQASPGERRE